MTILRDPEGGEGGNPTPPPAPQPQPSPAPTPPPTPPPTPVPTGVTLSADEHRKLIEAAQRAERLEKAETERETKRREAEEERLKKNGEYEKLIAQRDEDIKRERDRLADVERRSKSSERDRELALALAASPLVEGWADHLMKLWRDAFEVTAEGERWKVRTLDGKTPAEFVRDQLARPEFSHIVRAGQTTGATQRGSTTGRDVAAPEQANVHPAILHYNQQVEAAGKVGMPMWGIRPVSHSG